MIITIEGTQISVQSGATKAELEAKICDAIGTTAPILGLRQGQDVYPLQIVAATPVSFVDGEYTVILGQNEGIRNPDSSNHPSGPISFKLPGGRLIGFTRNDLHDIYLLVTHTGICGLDPHDIYDAVLICTDGAASMSFSQFQSYLKILIGDTDSNKNFTVTRLLFGLFHAIDINNTGLVSADDLTAVLVVICKGSASHKLRFLFEVFGTLGKDGLTRRQFWRYIRSILTALVQLSSDGASMRPDEARRMINDASIHVSLQVFGALDNPDDETGEHVMFNAWEAIVNSTLAREAGSTELHWINLLEGETFSSHANIVDFAPHKDFDDDVSSSGTEDEVESIDKFSTSEDLIDTDEEIMRVLLYSMSTPFCIEISQSDAKQLRRTTTTTSIGSNPPEHVHNILLGMKMQNGLIHRSDFESCLPLMARDEDDMPNPYVQATLGMMFDSHDRQSAGVVDFDELAAGFSLLSSGGKSEKLALAFEAFDSDNDGRLTRRELWKFLRAFLTSLLNFGRCRLLLMSEGQFDIERASVGQFIEDKKTSAIDSVTVEAAGAIFHDISSVNEIENGVSFDQFGAWYNENGSTIIPWLELLDIRKWPSMPDTDSLKSDTEFSTVVDQLTDELPPPAPCTSQPNLIPAHETASGEASKMTHPQIKEDALFATPINSFGDCLDIFPDDVDNMRRLVSATKLLNLTAHDISMKVSQQCILNNGREDTSNSSLLEPLGNDDFVSVLEHILPETAMDESSSYDSNFAENALTILFACLGTSSMTTAQDTEVNDTPGSNKDSSYMHCNGAELIAGISVLCSGDKSEKLAVAFDAFDVQSQGKLPKEQCVSFIRSFLASILALTSGIRGLSVVDSSPTSIALAAEVAAVQLVEKIFEDCHLNRPDGDETIEFDVFADWYTEFGFSAMQWLELLDRRKWPGQPQFEFHLIGAKGNNPRFEAEASIIGGTSPVTSPTKGPRSSNASESYPTTYGRLRVFPKDVEILKEVLEISGLADLDPVVIRDEFLVAMSNNNKDGCVVSRAEFNATMRRIIGKPISAENVTIVSNVLAGAFSALDRTGKGVVLADELIAGLSIFSAGNKSTKLAVAFQVFNDLKQFSDAGSIFLSKRDLWRYLRAFLSVIASLCGSDKGPVYNSSGEEVRPKKASLEAVEKHSISLFAVDNACVALTELIFKDVQVLDQNLPDSAKGITFENFADWYTYTGFEYAPWLELLDLRKWFSSLSPPTPQGQEDASTVATAISVEQHSDSEDSDLDLDESLDVSAADEAFGLLGSEESWAEEEDDDLQNNVETYSEPQLECLTYVIPGRHEGKDVILRIGPHGCDTLRFFLEKSGLGEMDAGTLGASVKDPGETNVAQPRLIAQREFVEKVRSVISVQRILSEPDIQFVESILLKMFGGLSFMWSMQNMLLSDYTSDEDQNMVAPDDELACAVVMFSNGSKSDKLAELFDIFDAKGSGYIPFDVFQRFIKAILTCIVHWTEDYWDEELSFPDPSNIALVVLTATDVLAKRIFREATTTQEGSAISFASFADWYTQTGHTVMPWLELMDTKKWPHEAYERLREEKKQQIFNAETQSLEATQSISAAPISSDSNLANSPIFNVKINSDGDLLAVVTKNLEDLKRFFRHTNLLKCSREELTQTVLDYGTGGAVEPSDYKHIVTRLIDSDSITNIGELHFVEDFLLKLYHNFDREQYSVVDASEIIAALCILSPGSKSEKLAFIFNLYDEAGQGMLEKYQMHCFLRALLVTLSTIATIIPSGEGIDGSKRDEQLSVDVSSLEMTELVFSQASQFDDSAVAAHSVTFDAFADWYTYGGHTAMPWLELLDLSKWASGVDVNDYAEDAEALQESVSGRSRKQSFLGDQDYLSPSGIVDPYGTARPAVFEFIISSTGSKMRICEKDIEMIGDTIRLARFKDRTVDEVSGIFSVAASSSSQKMKVNRLSLEEFESCVVEILTSGSDNLLNQQLESDEFEFVSAVLAGIFHSLGSYEDEDSFGTAAFDELVAGFSVFVGKGSKSEKLATLFDVFDIDQAGLISRHTLWRYIRSILASLCHLTEVISGDDTSSSASGSAISAGDSTFNRVIDQAVDELIHDIFAYRDAEHGGDADSTFGDSLISFDTFAQWYTYGGFEKCAWLELLDHRKWLPSSSSDAPRQRSNVEGAPVDEVSNTENQLDSLFEFQIDANGRKMIVCSEDCEILKYLLYISKLDSVSPVAVTRAMEAVLGLNADGAAKKKADGFEGTDLGINNGEPIGFDTFFSAIKMLLVESFEVRKQMEQEFFLLTLRNIHHAFTRAESDARVLVQGRNLSAGKVFAALLTSGMLIFTRGSKSEKLAIAFDLFCSTDGASSTRLNIEMFSLFLMSFMVVISTMTRHGRSQDTGVLHLAAMGIARQVFIAIGSSKSISSDETLLPEDITFQEFADWYTIEGHELVPWLELLDLRKWHL